ncbi:MAG: HAMP domain-containing histidine kinase [Chloroflexi bacterium]|nr:HAMP domain-containing histidine kinase [Chloroflexota bacterium]
MKRLALWAVSLIPACIGATVTATLALGQLNNPILYLRADLGTLSLLLGIGLSTLLMLALGGWAWLENQHGQTLTQTILRVAADRRRFLQRLDHELKNPLTAIRAGLVNVGDGDSAETLSSIQAQVQRISRLTADLRKLSELETRPFERSAVDMADLLQQVFELAQERPEAGTRRLSLQLPQAPWPLPAIFGDHDLLLLVVHNLLDNALKFTRPSGTVEVRAFEDGAAVVIEVADTGPGIPEEDMPHIWEELYRGQGARGVPGSGLGLALTSAIVQRHGGQIVVRSRPGQGTVFTVRLPIKS